MAQLPISAFLTDRLAAYDPNFELRFGTGFESLFFKPIQFIVQPLRDEANELFIGQSFLRILLTSDPDAFNEDYVDALASNLFVLRREGSGSSGTARAYFNAPVEREYPAGGAVFTGSNGLTYSNPDPYSISSDQMALQLDNGLYYMDVPVESSDTGADTELEVGQLVSLASDNDVVRVTNPSPISGGLDRESNTDFIDRIQNSIGVRDLVAGKGFRAILFENFVNSLSEVQPIGFGDPEMMRDILYNAHVGGKVDGYVKTAAIKSGSKDFMGVLTDYTRQTYTSANILLEGTSWSSVNNPNIDRSNNKAPILKQIKVATSATFTSPVDMSSPINLSVNQHIKIGVDGVFKTIRVAGVNPGATTRNEIFNIINAAFGVNIATAEGSSFKITSPSSGLTSHIVIDNPDVGNSALPQVFNLLTSEAPYTFSGDGPLTFIEGQDYEVDDENGKIRRIIGSAIIPTFTTGQYTENTAIFTDSTPNVFLSVNVNDILTISSGDNSGDYRIIQKTSDNVLVLDTTFDATETDVSYSISRTGIKSGEIVYVQYYYNPLSIDIGNNIIIDDLGRERGVRPGRDAMTISDLAFLRINSIEEIDPLTKEPTGLVLQGKGGWGRGGFGSGGFGVGSSADYRLVVNKPELRFSMYEDSYIVLNTGYEGLSFRVNYDYVPEVSDFHTFVQSENERTLDGDILIKHFIPAYVSGTIYYKVNTNDATVPTNDELLVSLKSFINKMKSGTSLDYTDIIQFMVRTVDPFDRYGTSILPFKLSATIYNTDGSVSTVTGESEITVPTPEVFPKVTKRPLSPRIVHWVADNITLVRM